MRALALLGVDGELVDALARHGLAQLALDEGLNHQRDGVEREQRLDASLILEEDRGDLVHGLDLLEALLDHGLTLVGLEHLSGGELAVVGHERVHAVAPAVIGDGVLVCVPLHVKAPLGDLAVGGVGAGTTAARLLEQVLLANDSVGLQVAADVVLVHDEL